MSDKTEVAPPRRFEEAAQDAGLPALVEQPGVPVTSTRKRKRPALRLEELQGADLKGKDLTRRKGLLPEHLARADLTGAKLPDYVAKFPALDQVSAISSEARKIFIGLLAACVYSWLVIGTTKDVQLIVNTATSPLPIINTPLPIAGFYVVGAALLAAVYCYLHFYLHRLWRVLDTLPAVFPEGMSLDDKIDPWPLTNLVRVYFERLKLETHPLKQLETRLSIALAWGLVPLTLVALWARYLPSHDWLGTYWLVILTSITIVYGWHFFRFARAALSGEPPPSDRAGLRGIWRELRAMSWAGRTFGALAAFAFLILWIFSFAAFQVNPRDSSWAAKGLIALRSLGIRTYADLREVNLAEPPDGWDGKDLSKIKRVDLRGRNLAFADATGAFLANADLRDATLTEAEFEGAQLQGADLSNAQLQGAELFGAQLQGADLSVAQLQGAHLLEAQLQGANLSLAELQGAALSFAQLQGANLSSARLQGAHLLQAQLQGANLLQAQLQGAKLRRAQLQGAVLFMAQLQGADLRGAQLQGADLSAATVWRAQVNNASWDLADLRGITVQPMTDSNIDVLVGEATKGIRYQENQTWLAEMLNAALRAAKLPTRPEFPEKWRSEPNVMFDRDDPSPKPFNWGRPKWATEDAYDEDLATFLGELACGDSVPEAQTNGLVRRALEIPGWNEPDRLWRKNLTSRLIGVDCPPAKALPDDTRNQLEELAARRDTSTEAPEASPRDQIGLPPPR